MPGFESRYLHGNDESSRDRERTGTLLRRRAPSRAMTSHGSGGLPTPPSSPCAHRSPAMTIRVVFFAASVLTAPLAAAGPIGGPGLPVAGLVHPPVGPQGDPSQPGLEGPEDDPGLADSQDPMDSQSGESVRPASPVAPLDREGGGGRFPSIAIGSDGLGLLSYFDEGKADPQGAHRVGVA